jgi:small-conductance mechanosensitive channel
VRPLEGPRPPPPARISPGGKILLFLPAILGALGMTGLLDPVQGMVDQLLAMLPNVLAAAAIGVVGWFVAKILRDLVSNLLAAAGADGLGERAGLRGTTTLSKLLGLIVYIFVLVPAIIAALNALQVEAISAPATEMLGASMAAIPNIFGAAVILGVAWFVSGFIAGLVTSRWAGWGSTSFPSVSASPRPSAARLRPRSSWGRCWSSS